ncbi:MAG TPA: GNAT family N-acetyltransferase [Blastocatellia bacterium]|nr:GNAT family N-acetyltransferase [Blastocatellia bacterium]
MNYEWQQSDFVISTDPARLDVETVHRFLSNESYWAQGRTKELVERSIANSIPFGIYKGEQQAGFCRVVTDYATFAWLSDVFVLPSFRGLGLSKWMMEVVLSHPELQGLRRWLLGTKDAQELYRKYGFTELSQDIIWMQRFNKLAE